MSTEAIEGAAPVTAPAPVAAAPVVEAPAPKVETAAPADKGPDPVPYSRFHEVNEAKKAAVTLREAAELKATEAATALEALRAEYAETTTKSETALQRAQREGQTYRAGVVDDDHVDTVLYKYSKVQADAEGNKPAYGEWLAGYVAQNPYLRGGQAAVRAPVDNGNGGAKPVAPKSELSREAIAAKTVADYAAFRGYKKT